MNYGFGQDQSNANGNNAPYGSKLAQYMQAGGGGSGAERANSTPSAAPSSSMNYQEYAFGVNSHAASLGQNSTPPISYPFSQMKLSTQQPHVDDGVSAFLNSNYANSPDYYQNVDGYEMAPDAFYMYQSQPIQLWKNRLKSQPRSSIFVDPNLKAELIARQLAMQSSGAPTNAIYPTQIDGFHNVTQLSSSVAPTCTPTLGVCASDTAYRAVKSMDGYTYCLRRISLTRSLTQKQLMSCENWKRIVSSSVVQLREVIFTHAFQDSSCLFVYDFIPLGQSLKQHYFGTKDTLLPRYMASGQKSGGIPETLLWSFVIQISGALRTIHTAGLCLRFLDLSRVLISGRSKFMLSAIGIGDFLYSEVNGKGPIVAHQVEDLRCFGKMLLILGAGRLDAYKTPEMFHASLKHIEQTYSTDLKNLIRSMYEALVTPNKITTINDIMPMIGARFYAHIESLDVRNNFLEDELFKEVENGRLFRILCKLNTVIERIGPNLDETWSETGDRYLLKLFHDYVFHQISATGKPWIDLSHIAMCLNKLDAGVADNIQLVSRDGDNMLIVSYAELRRCLDNSFHALITPPHFSLAAVPSSMLKPMVDVAPTAASAVVGAMPAPSGGLVDMSKMSAMDGRAGPAMYAMSTQPSPLCMAPSHGYANAAVYPIQKAAKRTLTITEAGDNKKSEVVANSENAKM